jgi:hypothetical protein
MTSAITSVMNSTALLPSSASSVFPTLHAIDVLAIAPLPPSEYPSPFQAFLVRSSHQPTVFFAEPLRSIDDYAQVVDALTSPMEIEVSRVQPKHRRYTELFEMISGWYEHRASVKPLVHPADQAALFAKAREAQEARMVNYGFYDPKQESIKEKIQELRLQEAKACHQAAALVTEPLEKLAWVQVGLLALNPILKQKISDYEDEKFNPLIAQKQLELGSWLYQEMGELFLNENLLVTKEQLSSQLFIREGEQVHARLFPEHGVGVPMQFLTAVCFHEAGKSVRKQGWLIYDGLRKERAKALPVLPWRNCYEEASSHYKRALVLLRSIDLSGPFFTNDQRLYVQQEVVDVEYSRWHAQRRVLPDESYPSPDALVGEWQKSAAIHFQCALAEPLEYWRRHHFMEQSKALAEAAYTAINPKQIYELYVQAYQVVLNYGLDKGIENIDSETLKSQYLRGLPRRVEKAKQLYEAYLTERSRVYPKEKRALPLPKSWMDTILSFMGFGSKA